MLLFKNKQMVTTRQYIVGIYNKYHTYYALSSSKMEKCDILNVYACIQHYLIIKIGWKIVRERDE